MGNLFQGSPQTATDYATSTSETPKWMQDAIYNQIQVAQNIANRPYESYDMPTVAELSPLQQQAYQQVQENQGNWQAGMNFAQAGMQGMTTAGTAGGLNTAQSQYLSPQLAGQNLGAGQNYYNQAGQLDIVGAGQGALSQAGQQNIMGAASPYLSQAGSAAGNIYGAGQGALSKAAQQDMMGAASPYLSQAGTAAGNIYGAGQGAFSQAAKLDMMGAASPYLSQAGNADIIGAGANNFGAAGKIDAVAAADPYLSQASKMSALANSQNLLNASSSQDIYGAAQPYMSQAGSAAGNIMGAAQPYMSQAGVTTAQALSDRALNAANPYLNAASQSSAMNLSQYMSPYKTDVMDVMAKQGARNLSENLLPGVSDAFIKAGQFGSSRMGEFGSRALRDTQESVLNQQAQMANQGYGQALSASQADLKPSDKQQEQHAKPRDRFQHVLLNQIHRKECRLHLGKRAAEQCWAQDDPGQDLTGKGWVAEPSKQRPKRMTHHQKNQYLDQEVKDVGLVEVVNRLHPYRA